MACCRAAKGACAGWKSPDDCCQTRDIAVASVAPAPLTAARNAAAPPVAWLPFVPREHRSVTAAGPAATFPFKRPHDPPHLHAFTLLI
jgi:hypothetical protein